MSESMSQDTGASVEAIGGAAPPSLSQETIDYHQGLLADPAFVRDYPAQAAMLRQTLDEALAAIGYQPPPADLRTPAQALHDQHRGVAFGPAGETRLPEHLAAAIAADVAGKPADHSKVAAQLAAAGLDVEVTLAYAQEALTKSGSAIKADQLSAHAAAQLSVWAQHLRAHAKTRPQ